ncbi:MAG TPA: MFS transporter [Pseudolysinimonas sp.]|nr:MFS transporter [Pseudolysinimonas sp.]
MTTALASAWRGLRTPRPWLMLAVVVVAQASTTVVTSTPAFLIPLLHEQRGLSLAQAGLLAAAPSLGLVLSLVAWGAATDRWGEHRILVVGLVITTIAVVGASFVSSYGALGAILVVAGIGAASTNAASGRVVVGWFSKERRGLAMGIRQSCQPLGVAVAALVIPPLVASGVIAPALIFGAVLVGVSVIGCLVVIVDPPRPERVRVEGTSDNPYRRDRTLLRIHLVSILLVVPQFALSTFGLVWFVVDLHWTTLAAGIVVAAAQFLGAGGRIAVGVLSDRVGSRLRPLRWVAIAGILLLLLTAAAGALEWDAAAAVCYVLASCISVADNGLSFTAVAEFAGPHWSGRALGAQNTGQFLGAAIVAPAVGALIGLVGYPAAFALVAIAPALAVPLVPSATREVHLS